MHHALTASAAFLITVSLGACASSGDSPRTERTAAGETVEKATKIKHDESEVPAQVKAIETHINRTSALSADVIEIDVSRNYEWDVALTGNEVDRLPESSGEAMASVATGNPRATFRNLDIRAWDRIIFRKSGFDVVPYIRITARGHAAHAVLPSDGGEPVIRRASVIRITNADIEYTDRDAISSGTPVGTPGRAGSGDAAVPVLRP